MVSAADPETLQRIVEAVSRASGISFGEYRTAVLERRIAERMRSLRLDGWSDYAARLASDESEPVRLRDALLIRTTAAFRGSRTFEALRSQVLPALARRRREVRVWVSACSTGEEAWSIALCLAEACEALGDGPRFSMLASDVHGPSLTAAEQGFVSDEALRSIPPELAGRYLEGEGTQRRVRQPLRERVQFAPHDMLAADQPSPKAAVLASFDLVSCRNLLIYLRPQAQQRVTERLVGACEPDGAIVLDESETLAAPGWERASAGSGIWTRRLS